MILYELYCCVIIFSLILTNNYHFVTYSIFFTPQARQNPNDNAINGITPPVASRHAGNEEIMAVVSTLYQFI